MGEPAENDDLTTAPPARDASTTGQSPASASVETVAAAIIREGPGTRVGLYKLLQLIGEGGFGSVFMAEQEQPVRRRVALKIIKLGMDTRQVVARFEQERQALALMDHPHIARVLDAGATDTGRPYFVMELVKGDPVVEYCDKRKLRIQARLELFEQVCTAVQHAHTKGIIHRDIKPSNVLVSTHDGRPHVKIIDFGIAKATAAKLTEKTLFTEHRQLIGTPQYMSPEQAEGSLDIDTRTDVYSLGVMLYELLTSSTPFTGAELRAAPHGDLQRMIREVEPPKPSTRLSRSVATLPDVAARRQVEPRMLGTLIRGELDWIVMKALEKDRERRYETANALALDIRRYLNGEVVMAAPPSAVYRFRKFLKRNRFQAAAAALIALTLVLGMAGTAWQAKRAADQRDLARSEAARADAAAKAETARAAELTVVSEFHETVLDRIDPAVTGMRLTEEVNRRFAAALEKQGVPEAERAVQSAAFRQQWEKLNATDLALTLIDETILKSAVEAIDEQFADQPVVDALLRQVMADRYLDLGLVESAMPLQKQALLIRRRVLGPEHPRTLDSINNMAILLQAAGRLAEAEPFYREGLEVSRRVLGPEHPDTLTSMSNMGFQLHAQRRYAEAEPFHREALEARRRVLGLEHPETLSSMTNMGFLLLDMGDLDAAEPYFREALETRRRVLGEEHPHTLLSLNALGVLLEHRGNLDEAERHYREALVKRRRLLGEQHPATLTSVMSLAVLLRGQGRNAEVVALLVPTEAAFRTAFADVNVQRLGQFLMHLGRARVGMDFDRERFSAAETNLLEAHSILRITSGEQTKDTRDSVAGLVELYEAWHAADPEKGYGAKAAEWHQRLGGMPAAATAPDSDSSESDASE